MKKYCFFEVKGGSDKGEDGYRQRYHAYGKYLKS